MTNKLCIFIALPFLGFFSSISFAALNDFNVYYLNGISNSPRDAKDSRDKLRSLVLPDVPDGNVLNLYNNNDTALREMIEAVRRQGDSEQGRQAYKRLWKCIDNPSPETCDPANPPTAAIRQIMGQTLGRYDQATYVQNPQLQAMISVLRDNYYNKKKKALLIAHSQGNFYANQIVGYLQSFDPSVAACVEVVGVATPATYVARGGSYETRSDDVAINAARAEFFWGPQILPPTWTPPFPAPAYPDPSHHKFVTSYLAPDTLRQRIRNNIVLQTASASDASCAICVPFNQTVQGGATQLTEQYFRRSLSPGRRTVNVRMDVDIPNDGYQYDNAVYIRSTTDYSNNFLLRANANSDGTYRYSFIFDSTAEGTNDVHVWVYSAQRSSVRVCIDCGNETASSPTTCP